MLQVGPDRADRPDVQALLARHEALMRDTSPAESCHVLAPDALSAPGILLLSARRGTALLGIGAVQQIAPGHGEVKSMHTAAEARGQGAARAILAALIAAARAQAMTRLSLETGRAPAFAPAHALYAAHGFAPCPPFGTYAPDPLSLFLTRPI
jgi:putative acetyltransferase